MAQVQKFFTSEILVLPKKINSLYFEENLEEKINLIKEIIIKYLATKTEFLSSSKNLTFFNQDYSNFPIEEVRRMQVEAEYSPSFSGQEKRVFVLLNFDSASAPAQNAALKTIEESPKDTLILLIVSNKERILETIASRCLVFQLEETASKLASNTTKLDKEKTNFTWPKNHSQAIDLAQEYKDRPKAIDLIEQLLDKKDIATKSKQALLTCYQDLRNNQNVQLAMENCFFSLVSLES